MSGSAGKGRFVWYDLMTPDADAAVEFYGDIVGWGTMPWQGATPYTMWTVGEQPVGGVVALPQEQIDAGVPPHWMAYVATGDVDATAAQADELGGTILHPATDIPDVGRFAVLGDPQGAAIAVFKGNQEIPPPSEPQAGVFSWHELATTDHRAAWDFYSSLFGWHKTDAMDMGEMGIYQMFGHSEVPQPLGGMFDKPAEMPVPFWLYYVTVPDVNEGAEKVKARGGTILNGPMEVPGGDWIVQCQDPQGAAFALHHTAGSD